MASRMVPLIGLLLFLGAIGWRTWLQLRRYGISGIMLFRTGDRWQRVRDGLFVLLVLVMLGQAVAAAASPGAFAALSGALPPAFRAVARPVGVALLFAGLSLMVISQLHLAASWRIGIEEGARPGLVTTGMYRFCRNPIFLFMLLVFAGFTLLLPNRVSGLLLVGALIGIREQVLAEEVYLSRAYGEDYRAYARRVGRFLPWAGRLSQ